jgi:pimeloyl-ACP methyl ester carboxylesterase
MSSPIADTGPREELVELGNGLHLHVCVWEPRRAHEDESAVEPLPFLLVHGLASNARTWDGVGRRLAQAGHLAVAVDQRGHGLSDKPEEGYGFDVVSADVRALIEKLGMQRPIVAGQSWGAAVRHPDVVRGIVLVDGGLDDLRDGFPDWDVCWERLAPPPLVGRPLADVEGYFRTNHADWPEEGIAGSLGNFEIRSDGTIAPWLSRDHHKAILHAMWEQRASELWRELRVPAMIVPVDGGDNDWTRAKRSGAMAAYSAARESGTPVRLQWFEGDHDVHAQHPKELTAAILDAERSGLFGGLRVA